MRLIISPISELRNRVFTSSDVVTGLVYLDINNTRLKRIETATYDTAGFRIEPAAFPRFHTLFESRQVLFPRPPLDNSVRYTLGQGRHEYRFGVDFSLLSLFAQAELLLISSCRTCQQWDSNRIYYDISVTLKGCGILRRQVRKSICLVSATLDPPGISRLPASKGVSRQSGQILSFEAFRLRSELCRDDNKAPPPYTPILVLRAGITGDGGLIYAGDTLPLQIWITVPCVAQWQLNAILKSVRLFMVDARVVSEGGHRIVRPAGTFIREVQLDVSVHTGSKNETFEVDPIFWKDCKVPHSLPVTKSTLKMVQPYLLQILCEFSCDQVAGSIFTSVLVPVDIATGNAPPKYRTFAGEGRGRILEGELPEYALEETPSPNHIGQ